MEDKKQTPALEQEEVISISFRDIFWSVLRSWRFLLVMCLLFGALLGGTQFARKLSDYRSGAKREAAEKAYAKEKEAYDIEKNSLSKSMEQLLKDLEVKQELAESSLMLQIDPLQVYAWNLSYFVDAGYQIQPSLQYQDPDPRIGIIRLYGARLVGHDYDAVFRPDGAKPLIIAHPLGKTTLKIVNVSLDTAGGFFTVEIRADSQERADKLLREVEQVIEESRELLEKSAGAHTITCVQKQSEVLADTRFAEVQEDFQKALSDQVSELEKVKNSLKTLKAPALSAVTKRDVISAGILFSVVGGFAGLAAAVIFLILRYLIRNRVMNGREIELRYGLPSFGPIGGAPRGKLDWSIEKRMGLRKDMSREEGASYALSEVKLVCKAPDKLLLFSSEGMDCAEELAALWKQEDSGISLIPAGDLLSSKAALEALSEEGAILLVERAGKSRHKKVREELRLLGSAGKHASGVVLLG